LVQTVKDMGNHVVKEQFREPFVRQAVGTGTKAFFDGPYGPFDFTDMTVGGNNVDVDGEESSANAFELVVAVDAGNVETTAGVGLDCIG